MIILPQLNDCAGDITKNWFVYYSVRDPRTNRMERFKTYKGINKFKNPERRYAKSEEIIGEISKKLKEGWTPFKDDSKIIYGDSTKINKILMTTGK